MSNLKTRPMSEVREARAAANKGRAVSREGRYAETMQSIYKDIVEGKKYGVAYYVQTYEKKQSAKSTARTIRQDRPDALKRPEAPRGYYWSAEAAPVDVDNPDGPWDLWVSIEKK